MKSLHLPAIRLGRMEGAPKGTCYSGIFPILEAGGVAKQNGAG